MEILKNKNILLFVPRGRGIYGSGIYKELEYFGAKVKIYDERPSENTFTKVILRLSKRIISPYLNNYYKRIIRNNIDINFDYIFVIRGEGLTPKIANKFKFIYPNAKRILYLWDSLKSNDVRNLFPHFDFIFSFDHEDAEANSEIHFRPLFYLPIYRELASKKTREVDLTFIGTVHSNRYHIIKSIERKFLNSNIKTLFYFYFPSKILYYRKKLLDRSFRDSKLSDFKFQLIGSAHVAKLLSESHASLDIEGLGQTGLTMRTIELLGLKRKLITTNKNIKLYDFYDENNILVIDRDDPIIDVGFIKSEYEELSEEIYNKYSLNGWITEIFKISYDESFV